MTPNDGYLPAAFTASDYRSRSRNIGVVGGAVVSGSFRGFDQAHLLAALAELGPGFTGVGDLVVGGTHLAQVFGLLHARILLRRRVGFRPLGRLSLDPSMK